MKLYTEEQVNELRRALRDIRDWDESLEDDWEDAGYRAMDALKNFTKTTPIELPTDEEIKEYATQNAFNYYEFVRGAVWYREQLKSKI